MKRSCLLLGLFVVVLGCRNVSACTCMGMASPGGAYAGADAVLVGTITKVEPTESGGDEYEGEQIAYLKIDQSFKGLEGITEIVLNQPGHNCAPKFSPKVQYLLYATYHKKEKTWEIVGCGRSNRVESAANDMLYLQALPDSANKSRISGTIEHYEDTPEKSFTRVDNLAGIKVTITGPKKSYEVYTDSNGVYEIYDLPSGVYTIKPELPPGFKVKFPMQFGPWSFSEKESVKVELTEKGETGSDFVVNTDALITGKVLGANNQIMPDVCLELIPVDNGKSVSHYFRVFGCTKENGAYTLTDMPPGSYYIVANREGKRTPSEPFLTTYYPGVFDKDKATVINVVAGIHLENYDIHIQSQLPTVEIKGVVVYQDGRPASDASLEFLPDSTDDKTKDGRDGGVTDAQGRFTLRVLQGSKGTLRAFELLYSSKYEHCPEADKWVTEHGGRMSEIESKRQRLEITAEVADIKLVIPLPSCKRTEKK